MPSILLFGATGFIGGSLLVSLKKSLPDYEVRALVRNPIHNDAVLASGATTIINASTKSLEKIESLSAEADIVINTATSDDDEFVRAILRGMKKRFEDGREKGILIQTSGTGVFLDGRKDGKFDLEGAKLYTDETEDDIRGINASMFHGNVDVPIFKANEEGYLNAYTICPAGIPGLGTGPVGRIGGIQHIINAMKKYGYAFYVGDGSNVFGAVHIDDLISLYILVLNKSIADRSLHNLVSSPYVRYYIASVQDVSWKDIATVYGDVLYKHGFINSAEPKSITVEEAGPFGFILGANSYARSVRAIRELGWKPREITLQMYEDVVQEVVEAFK